MSTEVRAPDFTQFEPKGSSEKRKQQKILPSSNRWWLADEATLPGAIMSQVAAIIQADRGRIDSYNTYAKLYGTYTPTFWNGYQLANSGRPTAPMRDRLTYNIVQSCIDATVAKIVKNKPKPMFLTSAGDSKVQRRAKKLDQFMYGLYYENDIYKLGPKILRDCFIFGEGIIHPYSENGRVRFERVLPYELLVDYLESHYGPESTKSIHRIKNIDRTELSEMFPEKAGEIARMTGTAVFLSAANRSVADTVTVVESWRLRVGSKMGRHCIVTGDTTLFDEDYDSEIFPFAICRFSDRLYGFYGQGMAEQLIPLQVEINRTLISIQRSLYLGGTHKIFVKNGSKVIKSHFDNLIGTILEYSGDTAPQYVVPQLVQPEIYSHLQNMIGLGYQQPGVSQMQASGMKTPGVNSGRAMRTEQNINTERFELTDQTYQNLFVDLSKITIPVARRTYSKGGEGYGTEIKVPGKRFIEKIKWSDVDLDDDEFTLQIYPVSKLPNDPEGRMSTIQEMSEAGWIDSATARRLLDFPDLDSEENLANAQLDYLHMILDKMVEESRFTAPDPFDNLPVARKLAMEYYSQGKLNDLDEDKLELLRRFMQQVDMLGAATAPPPMQPGAAGPAPANPTPAPVSDLIPNVNSGAGPQAA